MTLGAAAGDGGRAVASTRTRPLTGAEYLESVRDGREIWIYGERVQDVTTHPAFRNTVRMVARLYDALHAQDKESAHHRYRYRQRWLHAPLLQSLTVGQRARERA